MMRVCHVVQSYYPRDPRIRRQAEALVEAGFRVDVVCLRSPKERRREVVNGVHVYRVPLSRQRGNALRYIFEYVAFFCLASLVMAARLWRGYRVIHVSNMPDFLVFSATLPKLFGSRVLLDEHDPMPELLMAKFLASDDSKLIKFIRWQERISVHFAHQVLTVSDTMRQRIEKIAGRVPVAVVMNLPDKELFKSSKPRSAVPRSNNEFVLLYAGTVSKQYGLSMAVEAVSRLIERIPELRLRIVGDGDDVSSLHDLAEKLGIGDRVEFTGDVPFSRIPGIIEESDVGISTLKRDAMTELFFTNKGAEYVMMGLPAVVARTSAVEHYFPEGIVGMYEPDDMESFQKAVLELYENPELRADRSMKGIEFSSKSNWSTEKGRYADLIGSLSHQGPRQVAD